MNGVVYAWKVCTWIGPFYKIWPADQKKKRYGLLFFILPRILGGDQSGGLLDQQARQRDNTTITSTLLKTKQCSQGKNGGIGILD